MDHRLADLRSLLIVFAQPPIPPEPSECPLHHPPARQYREPDRICGPLDDFDRPTPRQLDQLRDLAAISAIRPDQPQPEEPSGETRQGRIRPIPILHTRRVHHYRKHQSERIDNDVPLAPIYLLAAVVAAWPPFSVVFTDWLSMIPALG